jgi:uroporphyrinogen-III synthase
VSELPLAGRRVMVTRAVRQASKLSEGLRALGAEPVEVPLLEIAVPSSYEPLDQCLSQLASYRWLILTSANTVRVLADRAAVLKIRFDQHSNLKVAAVGNATATAATEAGLKVSFVPSSYVAESLLEGLASDASGQRVLLARAAIARDVIPDALIGAGAVVDVVDAYQNVMPADAPNKLVEALQRRIDAVAFTSSSSVIHLAEAAGKAGIDFPFVGVKAISIGPITSQTLCENQWPPAAEADPYDISGLISAVVRALNPNVCD